ncbi:cartilage oligomeric matrix protein-like [Aedes aegypti]|uniref:Uncharacterized protein n=1 Tax=Aedes aegypti TaxID=7159 RepID=A0A6I8U8N6_AEDAE|nr:cartilage oligomeric matrix protein-like [Aedes aegypti]
MAFYLDPVEVVPVVVIVLGFAIPSTDGFTNGHRREEVSCRYGDARDHYFSQPFRYGESASEDARNLVEDDSPFVVADKCRLAKDMEQEIQYLRTLMDKCERCVSSLDSIPAGSSGRGVSCEDGGAFWCRERSLPCIDTPIGAVCTPCPVGHDWNGSECIPRAVCN